MKMNAFILENQKHHIEKCIEHLEIAKSYCELAWSYAQTDSNCALLADHEPWQYDEMIKDAKEQLSYIGAKWEIKLGVKSCE
jgi:hypothetical protein